MANYAIISPPAAGHIFPVGTLGVELARRGHRVTVVSHAGAAPLVDKLGLEFRPLDAEEVDAPIASKFTEWTWGLVKQADQLAFQDWFRWEAQAILEKAPAILEDLAVDGVLVDQVLAAGGTAAERVGAPFVTVCDAMPLNVDPAAPPQFTFWKHSDHPLAKWRNRLGYAAWHWFNRPILRDINRFRKSWQLAPLRRVDDAYSPLAQITQLIAEFDLPRETPPAHFHYVGSLGADRPSSDFGFPWDKLDGRPLIYASLGTVPDPLNRPVFPKIAAACVGLDAQLVLARGKWEDDDCGLEETHNLPGDPLVVDFAPQMALLERAAVLVTHCGVNTALEAISRGVPMVALARSADQPAIAARIEYSGNGLCGNFHGGTADELREVIRRVLTEERFRLRAAELQQAMRAAGGASRAADIVELACTTRQPVLAGQTLELQG